MSFSTFFLMVMVAYIFYYLVVIALDLVNKSRERLDNDGSVQYDFGHDPRPRPKTATLEVNENEHTGERHVTLNDGEQSVAEDIREENKLHSRVDLSLETPSKEENLLAILKNKPSINAH